MGVITYVSPGTQVTLAEYDSNFNTVYNEFNGNIDDSNIKTGAAVNLEKLGSTRTSAWTFSGGTTLSNAGGTGLTVSDGVTISTGGLTVTVGGITVTAGGLTVAAGTTKIDGSEGIDYNVGGGDQSVNIATIDLTTDAVFSWNNPNGRFRMSTGLELLGVTGLDITPPSITDVDLITVNTIAEIPKIYWDESESMFATDQGWKVDAGDVNVESGNTVNIKGVNGIDYNALGSDQDVDIITVQVGLTPKIYWDESESKFASDQGWKVDAGDVDIIGGQNVFIRGSQGIDYDPASAADIDIVTILNSGLGTVPRLWWDISAQDYTFTHGVSITSGGLTVTAGGVLVNGSSGIDYNTGGADQSVDIATIQVTGTPTFKWDEAADRFALNKGLDISAGNITLAGGATVDGVDVSVHAAATASVHGEANAFSANRNNIDQTGLTGTTKIQFNTETFDIGGDYDTVTNFRHTPQAAGKYLYIFQATVFESGAANSFNFRLELHKNGAVHAISDEITVAASGKATSLLYILINMNGSTDYLEANINKVSGTGTMDLEGNNTETFFQGFRQAFSDNATS